MKTELTQNDIYTPSEANAFHEGFTEATITRFSNETSEPNAVRSGFTVGEAKAFNEGFEAGEAKFGGTVYLISAAE
jgi:hypothetical protein